MTKEAGGPRTDRTLAVGGDTYTIHSLDAVGELVDGAAIDAMPVALKILLENLARHVDGDAVTWQDVEALARWPVDPESRTGEIAYFPVRVLMPDSSGIPLLADLTAMRDAVKREGGDPQVVNPSIPVDLVVDHSVTTDFAGTADAYGKNLALEYERNAERYRFLKWAAGVYRNFRVLPPGSGIVHQVNVEYLSRPIWSEVKDGVLWAYPDTLVGMDSHTPMINGLGVLGWGVGGIEAGSAMLGEPITLAIPEVVACRLHGKLRDGVTSTDLVLTVTERLRKKGVIGKLVEFAGPGVASLSLPNRATLANMAPEYGATMGFCPIDEETLRYLRQTGRSDKDIALAEAYAKAQGIWGADDPRRRYSDELDIDLAEVRPSIAGPRRPQDRRNLGEVPASLAEVMPDGRAAPDTAGIHNVPRPLRDGDVVIAAITSCTNTSNPSVLIGAGLLARKAREFGLSPKPWVKTSLSPGSRVVADYLRASGLQDDLDGLGFQIVGFGCMTCGGGSGALDPDVAAEIEARDLVVAAVLSSNRNFEGRIHPLARGAYIGSPPLTVAYALAGSVLVDFETDPIGVGPEGQPIMLADIWPSTEEIAELMARHISPELFRRRYAAMFEGDEAWRALESPKGGVFHWDQASTYLRRPPFFDREFIAHTGRAENITGARALLVLGDSITTDHISPGNAIPAKGETADYLRSVGVEDKAFHSYVARRVNHDVMLRGTFANIRLVNEMVPEKPGGFTRHQPDGAVMSVFEAANRYKAAGVPQIVIAGKEYGTGSSRDWAGKGTRLMGVAAIVAESFERIHRSNLVGMGVMPLQFANGETRETLGITGEETFDILGLDKGLTPKMPLTLRIRRPDGTVQHTEVQCRIDTRREAEWYLSGGVLQYVLAQILDASPERETA
ncbi:aconitate hydratase AcnA [Acuticoccus kandeliae]|uniref:aconitate hydratase AcnA n=1 Tax=Acuticoccus kandeliae TaxID=2073160 RepID=UPI000D3EC3E6|nr:aconitate hydratase AcnA [Acuticoccus kandeliae]